MNEILRNRKQSMTNRTFRFWPSKGSDPLTSVYRMTPRLHTSTSGPSYFFPWKSSGAAYGGEPQNVSSLLPIVNSLLKPKSAILIFISASNSRFSAWRERAQRNNTDRREQAERDCDSEQEIKGLPLDRDVLFFSGDNTAQQTRSKKINPQKTCWQYRITGYS